MLASLGNIFIASTLGANCLAGLFKKKFFAIFAAICSVLAFVILVAGFYVSDFALQNVFINSSSITPLIYKIAASWSSHSGSMLLFIVLLNVVSSYAIWKFPNEAASIQQSFLFALLLSLWLTANPFALNIFKPHEGVGLNPILQDMALLYHPPIVYLGYAFCFIPFCYLIFQNENRQFLLTFSRFALFNLTLGIGLGSWWAYRELGWGGFWFFDPIENISLIPWICMLAFNHCLMWSHKQLSSWAKFWGIFTFPLILCGIFLVRSNLLFSVHSFALDASKSIVLGAIAFFSLAASISSLKKGGEVNTTQNASNLLWLVALISILVSLLIPIFYYLVYKAEISIEVSYFKATLIPVFILLNIAIGFLAYRKRLLILFSILWISLICTLLLKIKLILASLAIFASLFLIIITLLEAKKRHAAMILGHLAYGILTLNIALNVAFESQIDLVGSIGDKGKMGYFEATIHNIKYGYGPNYLKQIVEIQIKDTRSNTNVKLNPENRWYAIENKMTAESSIYSFATYDLYAVLNGIQNNKVHVTVYYRPYISFIWLGGLILSLSFVLSLERQKHFQYDVKINKV